MVHNNNLIGIMYFLNYPIKNIYLIPKILDKVIKNLQRIGLNLLVLKKSELKGKKGNQEFFAIFKLS